MTNTDRARNLLNRLLVKEVTEGNLTMDADRGLERRLAQGLADATPPLLMPDLPSVHFTGDGFWGTIWEDCGVTVYRGGRTLELYAAMEHGELPEDLEPDEARQTAYALLAAANYAERNQE